MNRRRRDAVRVLTHIHGTPAAVIRERFPDVEVVEIPLDGPLGDARGEVLWTTPWGAANLEAALRRGVAWIHAMGTGVDRFPLELVGDRVLTCSRGASAVPISEWVLAVMLAFVKHLPESWIERPPETWSSASLDSLHGRTLALVGLGGIGRAVALRARVFGMRVRARRRRPTAPAPAGVEVVEDLTDLLTGAHHIVLAAPATPATAHLVDADALAAVGPGAHLVNVARGSLVDQDALRVALDDGRIARASLDTVDPEPLPDGHWMYTHPAVRLSPHVSWSAPDAMIALTDAFCDNLARYLGGESLVGVVDPAEGY